MPEWHANLARLEARHFEAAAGLVEKLEAGASIQISQRPKAVPKAFGCAGIRKIEGRPRSVQELPRFKFDRTPLGTMGLDADPFDARTRAPRIA